MHWCIAQITENRDIRIPVELFLLVKMKWDYFYSEATKKDKIYKEILQHMAKNKKYCPRSLLWISGHDEREPSSSSKGHRTQKALYLSPKTNVTLPSLRVNVPKDSLHVIMNNVQEYL